MISLLISLDLHGSLRVYGVCVYAVSPAGTVAAECKVWGVFFLLLLTTELLSRIKAREKNTHTHRYLSSRDATVHWTHGSVRIAVFVSRLRYGIHSIHIF